MCAFGVRGAPGRRIGLGAALVALAGLAWTGEPPPLRLVPWPKEIRSQPGTFLLRQPLTLEIGGSAHGAWGALVNEELRRAGLSAARVLPLAGPTPAFRLSAGSQAQRFPALPPNQAPERYALEVRPQAVLGAGGGEAGVFYGLQTLCQLIRANRQRDALPGLSIADWPTLRWRCFQDDLTRGPSSTLDTLKFEASLGSYLKLNLMTYYMEYQYAFKKHPPIGPPDGSLVPADLAALVAFAQPLQLGILGNQQSFGHFGRILRHPQYAALRETEDVLTPVREETYRLLDDLYSEVCPLLPFPWFNVCCDETYGLGQGPSKELAARIGAGGVYVRHLRRIHDLLRDKYNKRMMMWGDIILQHPAHLQELPRDTIMLTWGYDARPSFEDQIVPFARSGYDFFVCPGVNNWSRILPDFGVAVTNIQNFVRDGCKHGALGMIDTDWEDDGEALNGVKWHADAWAAECAWNGSATPLASFNRRVGAVLFGESGDRFGQAVELLTQTHRLPAMKGMFNARFWERDFPPRSAPPAVQTAASNLLAVVRPAIGHLEACRQEARCNPRVLDAFLFGARRMEAIGERMLEGLEAARLYEQALGAGRDKQDLAQVETLVRRNRDRLERLRRQFKALWLAESKPYALDWTLSRYTNAIQDAEGLLRKLAAARSAAARGQPLPAPEELGLALPKPLSRRVRPRETPAAPLEADLPWADPVATHRLGLVVRAGAAERFGLPVEVELALPAGVPTKPVRAFVLAAGGAPTEVPAQWDPLERPGLGRLVLVLPSPLPQRGSVSLHVYLGADAAAPALPGAARTRPDAQGVRGFENGLVRLQLRPEGAHVYRWEVKGAGDRDLTMPGETGWAGFADQAPYRGSSYRLRCTASGPAMVEFYGEEPLGHSKTIRLYAGASWIEVFLSEPTSIYWDFDNPRNFAADGPTPGAWLFSNGQTGPVGREADGVPAQVKATGTLWGGKFNSERLALGLATPGTPALHVVAPGAGAGGVGIENSPPVQHLVTFAGSLDSPLDQTLNRLESTLDLKRPIEVVVHGMQQR